MTCSKCGRSLGARAKRCFYCGTTVGAEGEAAAPSTASPAKTTAETPKEAPVPEAPKKIRFACSCGKVFNAPPSAAGKKTKCSGCGKIIVVPSAAPVPKPVEPVEKVIEVEATVEPGDQEEKKEKKKLSAIELVYMISCVAIPIAIFRGGAVWEAGGAWSEPRASACSESRDSTTVRSTGSASRSSCCPRSSGSGWLRYSSPSAATNDRLPCQISQFRVDYLDHPGEE